MKQLHLVTFTIQFRGHGKIDESVSNTYQLRLATDSIRLKAYFSKGS